MDLNAVREMAIEATARTLFDKNGVAPDEESEEWEAEYRRQFELARKRAAAAPLPTARTEAAPAPDEAGWPEISGAPTQQRWAAQLRADRLKEIRDREIRDWLIATWTKAASWLNTRDLSTPVFLQRVRPHFEDYRRQSAERAAALTAERRAKEDAVAALRREVETAGITTAGLIELIDIAERLPAVAIKDKLAELDADGRNLRIFETADPAMLMVLEKNAEGRADYAIERDDGLVADLRLYSRAAALGA
jgi:hypothetical protein